MTELIENRSEEMPSMADLNIKLERASAFLKLMEDTLAFVEDAQGTIQEWGIRSTAFDSMFQMADLELTRAQDVFDAAFSAFTTGKLLEAE